MWFRLAVALTLPALPAWGGAWEEPQGEFFEKRIRPVLAIHCAPATVPRGRNRASAWTPDPSCSRAAGQGRW